MKIYKYYFKMAKGTIEVLCSEKGVFSVRLGSHSASKTKNNILKIKWQKELVSLFNKYVEGKPVDFSKIPLDLDRGTPFQRSVWNAAREIKFGRTLSYGELASKIGNPKASRAVGQAMGRNPVAIIVPCHRVIASDGSLGGFTGGLKWKRALLNLEKININD